MIPGDNWEVEVRNAVSGERVWCQVISIGLAMHSNGPVPVIFYEDDDGKLAIILGSSAIRHKTAYTRPVQQ